MEDNSKSIKELTNLINQLTDEIHQVFDVPLDSSFRLATTILNQPSLPNFGNIKEEENRQIHALYSELKESNYRASDMRRAYREAYLTSQREKENYTVDITLELPLIYLKVISETLIKKFEIYEHKNVLNALANDGNLSCALAISSNINESDLYVTVKDENELKIAENLRDLCAFSYPIQMELPDLSFRCDLIVSDPFLRDAEDILVFFADYQEYLNYEGFFVCVIMTEFVRSRVFTDMLEQYGFVLLGVIEYPKDLLEGPIKSSIVILEKKDETNVEFFATEMPSVKKIEDNIKVMNDIKKYLNDYLGGIKNENNVN